MNLLAIDTSTELASVALAVGDEMLTEEQGHLRQHAQFLLPMIERLLAAAQLRLNQLDGIVFGRGPGSFTGLRITCSVAKALAYAHSLPMYPVSSLLAIANEVYQMDPIIAPETQVLAMIDARMHQVYWGCFARDSVQPNEQVSSVTDMLLPSDAPLILAGVGFESYLAQLSPSIQAQIIKQQVVFPHARSMIRVAQSGQIQTVSAQEALPVYVRNQVVQGGSCG